MDFAVPADHSEYRRKQKDEQTFGSCPEKAVKYEDEGDHIYQPLHSGRI